MKAKYEVKGIDLKKGCNFLVICTPGFCEKVYSKADTEEQAIDEAKDIAWQATSFEVIDLRNF